MPSRANDSKTGATERLPKGSECQCRAEGCGLVFTSESAFERHWTKGGHVHPSEVGMEEKARANGPTWGMPGDPSKLDRIARRTRQEATNGPSDGGTDE